MRRGSPRRGHVRLGELKDNKDGLSSLPRREKVRLGQVLLA